MVIAIVDDEPKVRKGLKQVIQDRYLSEMEVVDFADAWKALEYLTLHPVELIICDIKMPELNGLEMLKLFRKENQETQIMILSGFTNFEYAQQAIELGVRKYLTKPTNMKELFALIDQIHYEWNEKWEKEYSKSAGTNLVIKSCVAFLQANYREKLTLQMISKALYISPNYLCRLFKREMHQTLFEYLQDYRLEISKKYLKDIRYKVFEVAEMVGYSDAKYFSSQFKKKYGITPVQYRNKG